MKITPRLLVVLVCAWCGLPLVWIVARPAATLQEWTSAPLLLIIDAVRATFVAIGWAAFAHRALAKGLSMVLAVAWTAIVGLLAVLAPFGTVGILLLLQSLSGTRGVLSNDAVAGVMQATMASALALLAWAWLVAILARRLEPGTAKRAAPENRMIGIGLAVVAAWTLAWPLVHRMIEPLREIRPGLWVTDAAHARIVLTPAQRQALSPQDAGVVDDVNDDVAHIAAGQAPLHSTAKPGSHFFESNARSAYFLIAYSSNGKPSQIDVRFYKDALQLGVGGRTFLLR